MINEYTYQMLAGQLGLMLVLDLDLQAQHED